MKIGFLLRLTVLIFWCSIDNNCEPFKMFHNWLAPKDQKKNNTDMMLLLSGEYRIRTDDPLTARQMLLLGCNL